MSLGLLPDPNFFAMVYVAISVVVLCALTLHTSDSTAFVLGPPSRLVPLGRVDTPLSGGQLANFPPQNSYFCLSTLGTTHKNPTFEKKNLHCAHSKSRVSTRPTR